MINKKILKIRKKLDLLDDSFLKLLKQRSILVDQVLANKKYKKDIIDRKRILIILKNISVKSKKNKLDEKVTKRIWKAMIGAFIDYEYRNFKKQLFTVRWKFFFYKNFVFSRIRIIFF